MPTTCFRRRWIKPQIDFENEGGETYICGNPPYLGSSGKPIEQKGDPDSIFAEQ